MKIVSFDYQGTPSYGVVRDGGVIDAGARLKDRYPTLRAALAAGAVAELGRAAEAELPAHALDDVSFLPVIPDAQKIILVGLNYETHREETGAKKTERPVLFSRFADSQVGHKQPMIRPRVSGEFDFEGELAVIIGEGGRDIAEADALRHVAGYACYNDGSVRDWQRHTHQYLPGKNFPATGGFGPWMVSADEIPDPARLTLTTRLNGEEMQRATTDDLIFSIPHLIAYVSTFTPLGPGDVISTGTPGGVGFKRNPPLFMKAGDVVEVEITGIGTLSNPIMEG